MQLSDGPRSWDRSMMTTIVMGYPQQDPSHESLA